MTNDGSRVLIAERDANVRRRLFKALLDLDVFSDFAPDGGEAMAHITERPYALMLLDLGLPQLDLVGMLEVIKTLPERQRPIVIAFATGEAARDLDCDLVQIVMRRPINVSHVADLVQSCMRESQAARESELGLGGQDELTA